MKDHRSYIRNLSSCDEKNSGLNGIRTHDLCDTGAALLPIELSSRLGADHSVSSIYTRLGDEMIVNI